MRELGSGASSTLTTQTPTHRDKKKNRKTFPVRTIMPEKLIPDQKCHKTWSSLKSPCQKTFDFPFCLSFSEVFCAFFPPVLPPVCSCLPVWQVLGNTAICLLQRLGPKHVGEGRLFRETEIFLGRFTVCSFVYLLFIRIPRACCAARWQTFPLECNGFFPTGPGRLSRRIPLPLQGRVQHMAIVMEAKRK